MGIIDLGNPSCGRPIIYLHGYSFKILTYIINFMYLGRSEVPAEHFEEFFKAAKDFKIHGLAQDEERFTRLIENNVDKTKRKLGDGKSNESETIQIDEPKVAEIPDTEDDDIYMDMKKHQVFKSKSVSFPATQNLRKNNSSPRSSSLPSSSTTGSRRKDMRITRYQNSLKHFENYKKNFHKQESVVGSLVKHECETCDFSTNFPEIFKRHQLRHQLESLQNSGLNISKDNF